MSAESGESPVLILQTAQSVVVLEVSANVPAIYRPIIKAPLIPDQSALVLFV